jgi:hypothetical protein
MRGYKALVDNLTNRYGFSYDIGKKYFLDGELKWRENGFHFCLRPEDTLRYVDGFNDQIMFALVEGSGELVLYEDEYYGFYDMYAASEMTFLKIIPREEIFRMIIDSKVDFRVKRFASLIKLREEEINEILKKYPVLQNTIDYYQNDEFVLKRKLEYK